MKKMAFTAAMLMAFVLPIASAKAQPLSSINGGTSVQERHPFIRHAIRALQQARTDLQDAAHDYCGHRKDALEATDKALEQLRLALGSDRAEVRTGEGSLDAMSFLEASWRQGGERHPKIRQAVNALERARGDLQDAAHDFHGHREAALDATDKALKELREALACDKR